MKSLYVHRWFLTLVVSLFLALSSVNISMADLGLESKDFGHSRVDGNPVSGDPVTGPGLPSPGGGAGGGNDDDGGGGSGGDTGEEVPTCQTNSDNAMTEADSCKTCNAENPSTDTCGPDTCLAVYSYVNLFTRQYQDDIVDMKVKAPGGHIKLFRIYTEEKWQFGHEFNRLDLSNINTGKIVKSNLTYQKEEDELYHYRDFTIEKQEKNYRWENKWGSYVIYNAKGRMVEAGDRVGVLARYHWDNEKLISINDRRDKPIFHFTYTGNKITSVNDEHDRIVHYTWDGDKLTTVKDVLGYTTTYTYDENNRLAKKADEADREFYMTYYEDGAVKSVKSKMGGGDTLSYNHDKDSDEYYAKATSAMGKVREYWFDAKGETKKVMVNGNLTRKIDWYDGKKTITNEIGDRTINSYDENDNLTKEEYTDGSSKNYEYDSKNNLISKINELGVETRYIYNTQGLIQKEWKAYKSSEQIITHFGYDSDGNLISKILGNNNPIKIKYKYDNDGNIIAITNPEEGVSKIKHDYMGNPVKQVDANGLIKSMAYDLKGNLTQSTPPSGRTLTFSYDAADRRLEIIDQDGGLYSFKYDAQDNLIEQKDGLGGSRKFNFDKDNRLTKKIDEEGHYLVFFYDGSSERFSKVIDGNGNETEITYSGFENCGSCSTTFGKNPVLIKYPTYSRQFIYDSRGRVVEKIDILSGKSNATKYMYDKVGNIVAITDRAGGVTRRKYNSLNRLVSETDSLGNSTRMSYNEQGKLELLVDAKGQETHFEYNKIGRKIKEIKPLKDFVSYTYDNGGRLLSRIDPEGQKLSYLYDENTGYLVELSMTKIDNSQPIKQVRFEYDKQGRMTNYDDGITSAIYEYDRLGRKISEQVDFGTFKASHSYTYYLDGQIKSYEGPDGKKHSYNYNSINKLERIDIESVGAISFESFKWYLPQKTIFPGGVKLDKYDGLLRLTNRKSADMNGGDVLNLSYQYDSIGNVSIKKEGNSVTNYVYDGLQRLIKVKENGAQIESYSYDQVNNRISSVNSNYQYDKNNQLLAVNQNNYEYNRNGSPVRIQDGEDEINLKYSFLNRLEKYSTNSLEVKYYFDPFGRRLSKSVNGKVTWFYYTDEGLVAEFGDNGNLQRSYAYRPDRPWSTNPIMTTQSDKNYFFQNDHLGVPHRITDIKGGTVWQARYDAFGKAKIENSESVVNNFRLPGQYYDDETGLHYNLNRFYDPSTGRYVTADPIGLSGGINRYAYVAGNPINLIDPLGLACSINGEGGAGLGWEGFDDCNQPCVRIYNDLYEIVEDLKNGCADIGDEFCTDQCGPTGNYEGCLALSRVLCDVLEGGGKTGCFGVMAICSVICLGQL